MQYELAWLVAPRPCHKGGRNHSHISAQAGSQAACLCGKPIHPGGLHQHRQTGQGAQQGNATSRKFPLPDQKEKAYNQHTHWPCSILRINVQPPSPLAGRMGGLYCQLRKFFLANGRGYAACTLSYFKNYIDSYPVVDVGSTSHLLVHWPVISGQVVHLLEDPLAIYSSYNTNREIDVIQYIK
jgi:hypothetical protein